MSQDPSADLPQNKTEENSGWNHLDEVPAGNWKPEKRDRDRSWEKKNPSHSYRGVRPEVHQQILALAKQLMVSVGDVADVFAQYAIACLERGDLQIEAYLQPQARRRKLSVAGQAKWREVKWGQTPPQKIKKKDRQDDEEKLWERVFSYRVSPSTHQAICKVAKKHNASNGDVVTLFFRYGLQAYERGELVLEPQPVTVKMTLSN
jgi:hypothetical protein